MFPGVTDGHEGKPQNIKEYKKDFQGLFSFFFTRKAEQVKEHKNITNTSRPIDASCVVEFVSLICFPCAAPGRGLSKSFFHECQDQATAVTAWHPLRWFEDAWGGGGLQDIEGEAKELKSEECD